MKKILFAALCCILALSAQAREVTYNVYYNEITTTRGELYLYSERYLGTTDVIMADSHTFELDKIKLVSPEPKPTTTSLPSKAWESTEKTQIKTQLPLSEETLMATNLAKKAESVAKQIYRIREIRMNLLAGDAEHMPNDGKSMELVLNELKKQEKALTSMFVGSTTTKTHRKSFTVSVSDTDRAIQLPLIKFSKEQGPLSPKANNGDMVTLNIIRTAEAVLAPEQPKKGGPVYEDKLTSSKTTITYLNKTIYEKTCAL